VPCATLRDLLWCSIDNDDSLDLDQLSLAEDLAAGTVKILIAVADVDALVAKNTPIDWHGCQQHRLGLLWLAMSTPCCPSGLSH